jgi:hypothetical protein
MSIARPVIWAYTYKLSPPLSVEKFREVKLVLEKERDAAKARSGTWEARLVADERISHILVLSDSPDLETDANRNLEQALKSLNAYYNLTVPMVVDGAPADDLPQKDE